MSRAPVRVIRAADCRRMPWKNGGGETIEIAVHPEGAGLDDFDWRLSAARVASDGPFSLFPGVDRTLAILEGAGLRLMVDDTTIVLDAHSAPYFFPADVPTRGTLLAGPVADLNIMTRRDRLHHRMRRVEVGSPVRLDVKGDAAMLVCTDGELIVEDGPRLGGGDCIVCREASAGPEHLTVDGNATVYLIEIATTILPHWAAA